MKKHILNMVFNFQTTLARVVTEIVVVITSRQSSQIYTGYQSVQGSTLVFKMREVKQPMYLAELIEDYKPARELRSISRLLLKESCIKTTTGQR